MKVREKCGVRGVKVDKNYCVLPGCECNEEKDSYLVNGDVLVKPKGNQKAQFSGHQFENSSKCNDDLSGILDQKQTRGIWGPSKLWTEVQSGGKYIIPYRPGR